MSEWIDKGLTVYSLKRIRDANWHNENSNPILVEAIQAGLDQAIGMVQHMPANMTLADALKGLGEEKNE